MELIKSIQFKSGMLIKCLLPILLSGMFITCNGAQLKTDQPVKPFPLVSRTTTNASQDIGGGLPMTSLDAELKSKFLSTCKVFGDQMACDAVTKYIKRHGKLKSAEEKELGQKYTDFNTYRDLVDSTHRPWLYTNPYYLLKPGKSDAITTKNNFLNMRYVTLQAQQKYWNELSRNDLSQNRKRKLYKQLPRVYCDAMKRGIYHEDFKLDKLPFVQIRKLARFMEYKCMKDDTQNYELDYLGRIEDRTTEVLQARLKMIQDLSDASIVKAWQEDVYTSDITDMTTPKALRAKLLQKVSSAFVGQDIGNVKKEFDNTIVNARIKLLSSLFEAVSVANTNDDQKYLFDDRIVFKIFPTKNNVTGDVDKVESLLRYSNVFMTVPIGQEHSEVCKWLSTAYRDTNRLKSNELRRYCLAPKLLSNIQ